MEVDKASSYRLERNFITILQLACRVAKDFAKRVLDVEWAWISDESSLSDFSNEVTNDSLVQRIRAAWFC
jgi:hypothetical protein